VLSAVNLSRSYAGVPVVRGASIEVGRGQIHALVGENGAGKSTMLRMIAGLVQPDSGTVEVDGEALQGAGRRSALRAGIAMVTQELAAIPARTVVENVFLGHRSRPLGDARRIFGGAYERLCERAGIWIDPLARAGSLSLADRQLLEILRALATEPRVLLLDEPTTAMGFDQSEKFSRLMSDLAASGLAILWVSHHLDEVRARADVMTVMRNGEVVAHGAAADFSSSQVVHLMVGFPLEVAYPRPEDVPAGAPSALEVRGLRCHATSPTIAAQVAVGEIVGCAGLVGAGRSSFARAVFGAVPPVAGEVRVAGGGWFRPRSTRQSMGAGIAMVPEDRHSQGLVVCRPVGENLILPSLGKVTRFGLLTPGRAGQLARRWVDEAGIRPANPRVPAAWLSGGNQQKTLLKMWLETKPKVIIFDEPTRGVSMDAKVQIHQVMVETAKQGVGVVLISSELDEVLALSHRVLVFKSGEVVAELSRAQATREAVMAAAFGTSSAEAS
jgi:rhamnose transport system ATP-binding protein